MSQDTHKRQNYQPSRDIVASDQGASRRHATQDHAQNQSLNLVDGQTIHHVSVDCQLSLRGACIQGSGPVERTTRRDEQTKPRCTQNPLPQRQVAPALRQERRSHSDVGTRRARHRHAMRAQAPERMGPPSQKLH